LIGQTLAHYEITELLGKGGMGEVYRARDTKLGRDVALKILPREMSGDPERIARFQREARTLASLQHSNVASIYGFEDLPEARFLVMELVEGEDLSERLQRGHLSVEDSIEIAAQIAVGLEVAHEQGIVHRDLKPANVKITPEGTVKILDFGLARAYAGDVTDDSDLANSPTITAAMTQAGTILGTAAYMSPEQARGKSLDKRADIWAFGVILYEMLTGERLFVGETVSDTLAGVLKTEIDLNTLPDSIPTGLVNLLERCLDRDVKSRLRDIGEARVRLSRPLETETAPPPSSSGRGGIWIGGALILGLVLGAVLVSVFSSTAPTEIPPEPEVRFSIDRRFESTPRSALSPDGRALLYVDGDRLWVRRFDEHQTREVDGTEGVVNGTWSPDGEWIAYSTVAELFKSRPDGSNRLRLCAVPNDMHAWAGAVVWTLDDRILFSPGDSGVWEVAAAGGDPKVRRAPDEGETDFHQVSLLPDDRGMLLTPHADLLFDSIDVVFSEERRRVLRMEGQQLHGASYTAGHMVFGRQPDNPGVWAVPFSLDELETTGEPFLVVADAGFPVVSPQGHLVYVPAAPAVRQIVRLDARGNVTDRIGDAIEGADELRVSPDGNEAVFVVRGKEQSLWIADLDRGERRRLTFDDAAVNTPTWSPDGTEILYSVGEFDADMHVLVQSRDGATTQRIDQRARTSMLTRDRQIMVFTAWDEANEPGIGMVPLGTPEAEPTMLVDTSLSESGPDLSPDDRFVAYQSLESGVYEIYVQTFPEATAKWQLSQGGGNNPRWSASGDRLYFTTNGGEWLMVVEVSRDPVRFSTARQLFPTDDLFDVDPAPDGGFYALRRAEGGRRATYEVWLNWAASLQEPR
jgi:serine/threonine protein kinase